MIDFPASPTIGQQFIPNPPGNIAWTWDGTKWVASGLFMLPPLATGDNRLINGDMLVNQRVTASGTTGGYTVDRWYYGASPTGKITWSRVGSLAADFAATGCGNFMKLQTTTAYTPATGDLIYLYQPIEADLVSDFRWGTMGAQPVTLSFWAFCSLTGTFGGSITNAATRSYPFTYSIPAANTWTKIAVTIPGDTGGTWVMSGNGAGVNVFFDLGSGATYRGPAGAWASGNFTGANGSANLVTTLNATLYLTGIKLELGSAATIFNKKSLTQSLLDCQRYFYQQNHMSYFSGASGNSSLARGTSKFACTMRIAPAVNVNGGINCSGTYGACYVSNTNSQFTVTSVTGITTDGFDTIVNSNSPFFPSNTYMYACSYQANAEL